MTKSIKLSLMAALLALVATAISLSAVILSTKTVSAATSDANFSAGESTYFRMENSVKLRLDTDGFAFKAKMDKATYEEILENDNQRVMFILIPYTYKARICAINDGITTHYYRAIARYSASGEGYEKGDYNANASLCVYVEAGAYYDESDNCYYLQAGVANVKSSNRELGYMAVAVIEEKVYTNEVLSGFNYTYANLPENSSKMPETNISDVITSALYKSTDYISTIQTVYDWFGTEDYPVSVDNDTDYNALKDLYADETYGDYVKGLYYDIDAGVENVDGESYPLDNATTTYTVSVAVNNAEYGTVSKSSVKRLASGAAITENGAKLTVGGTAITAIPTANNAQYTYTFTGWSVENGDLTETVTESATITANFERTTNKYTITWKDADGTILETDENVEYGTTPSYDGATPTKAATAEFTYTFNGWDSEISPVTGNKTYTAQYSSVVNEYTVTIVSGNAGYGTVSAASVANVPYGTEITTSGNKVTINGTTITATANARTAQYSYAFTGWTNGTATVEGNLTVTANFERTTNKYTITWKDADGTILETDENVEYGTMPSYDGATPTKAATAEFTYTFSGWDSEISSVTGNKTYTAQYSSETRKYTVTIVSGNADYGTVSAASVANVPYGTKITTSGNTVTINGTTITATANTQTAQYTYAFNGWTNGTATVKGNLTVTANFTRTTRTYTVSGTVDGSAYGVSYSAITATASNGNTVSITMKSANVANYSVSATYGTNLTLTFKATGFYDRTDTFTVNGNTTKNYAMDDPVATLFYAESVNNFKHTGYRQFTGVKSWGDKFYGSTYGQTYGKYYYMEYNVVIDCSGTSPYAQDFGVGFLVGTGNNTTGIMMARVSGTWKYETRTFGDVWYLSQLAPEKNVSAAMSGATSGTAVKLSIARYNDFIAMFVNDSYVGKTWTTNIAALSDNGNGYIGLYSRSGVGSTFSNVSYFVGQEAVATKLKTLGVLRDDNSGLMVMLDNNMVGWGNGFTLTDTLGNAQTTSGTTQNGVATVKATGSSDFTCVQYSNVQPSNYYLEATVSGLSTKNTWGGYALGFNVYGGAATCDILIEKISNTEGYCVRAISTDWTTNKTYAVSSESANSTLKTAFATLVGGGSVTIGLRRNGTSFSVSVNGTLIVTFTNTFNGYSSNANVGVAAGFATRANTVCTFSNMKFYTIYGGLS